MYFLYCVEFDNPELTYIGISKDVKGRLKEHRQRMKHKYNCTGIKVLKTGILTIKDGNILERIYIYKFHKKGFKVINENKL